MDALEGTDREFDGLVRVTATIAEQPSAVIQLSLTAEELDEVSLAASRVNEALSDYVRRIVLEKARSA